MEIKNEGLGISNSSAVLTLENVSYAWSHKSDALNKCSFSIPHNGLWMLVGSNGSGKSTLFKLISGILKPDSGSILSKLKPALMLQNPDHQLLFPSCESDLLMSVPMHLDIDEKHERIDRALTQVGLTGLHQRPIHTLSGGQKQRLALAGALVSEANLLLLDEPTALLDPPSQNTILSIVRDLCTRTKNPLTALWITHRLEELEFAHAAAIMENGFVGPWEKGHLLRHRLNHLQAVGSKL